MKQENKILSNITVHMKYARYNPELQRRETWEELATRNMNMHVAKYPKYQTQIEGLYRDYVFPKKVLPSMRSFQFAGKPIQISPNRVYNCAYMPVEAVEAFAESMFLLLGGTGVGYSVQRHHVEKLPEILKPREDRKKRYLVADSIEGWADAVKVLMRSYFGDLRSRPMFDFSDIREKGSPLITSGGQAPGADPLRNCLFQIERILERKQNGDQLQPIEVHDIMCHIADAVLAGGIRRAALISLFSADDMDMITCKSGSWWENNPQRGRANNSAVLLRNRVSRSFFMNLWQRIKDSGSGEPGIYLSNDKDWGTNPCCEIALRPYQFCNLTEINASSIESEEDFYERSMAAAFLGTLQATYTDFHYLRDIWRKTTEKDALLGVSMTGIASNAFRRLDLDMTQVLQNGAEVARDTNEFWAENFGINSAARLTCIKPAGTTSLVLGSSSGIHAWHDDFYIRRIRVGKNEAIYGYLLANHPELVEDEAFKPHTTAVISIPQSAPSGATTRSESALSMLERIRTYSRNWVREGHNDGVNSHNVSATVSIREEEWDEVAEWMWNNRDYYNGLSILPYDGGTYTQAPFETISEEQYEKMLESLNNVDLTKIIETEDNTDLQGEIACAGGLCEI